MFPHIFSNEGRQWYADGKLDKKHNSFDDFIAAAEHVVDQGYTTNDQLVARGSSAGGLLVAACANMKPHLFGALCLHSPFLDIYNTLMDKSLPLSVHEYDEWGDPNDPDIGRYIKVCVNINIF